MTEKRIRKRVRERLELKLPVRVHCRETADFDWIEVTRLINVTPFGAGFTLKRPTEKGRLLHMTIPMPRQLRTFDHVEDQYRVWALVRYVRATAQPGSKGSIFEVGAAFVGKHPPMSYEEDPSRRYEVVESGADLKLSQESNIVEELRTADMRADTRHVIPVDMFLELINEKGEAANGESTVTENISRGGATVFTSLDISVGRFVRLTSQQYNLTVYAVVRGRSKGADNIPRVHLQFVDKQWPL